jgi:hypothetical protein
MGENKEKEERGVLEERENRDKERDVPGKWENGEEDEEKGV